MSAEKNLVNNEDLVHFLEALVHSSSCPASVILSQFFGIGFHDALRETTVLSPPLDPVNF